MISTLIFDLDGLLADTEKLHCQAYQDVLCRHGISLDDATFEEHWIRSGKGISEYAKNNNLSLEPEAIKREKAQRYTQLVSSYAEPMPGAENLLNQLSGQKMLALASSSYADAVECVITTLGFADFFAFIASGNSVKNLKPHPDIFLHVAEQLNVVPSSCLVLEDAEKGVIAARSAGMKCIAVPNEHTKNNDFSQATLVVSSLEEVTLELIGVNGHL